MCKKTNYHGTSNTRIDKCMRPLVKWLKEESYYNTVASCCGHGKYPITVVTKYYNNDKDIFEYVELFSDTIIPRTRNFYKKDKAGYYFIPEVDGFKKGKELRK